MRVLEGQHFVDEHIELRDVLVTGCTFDGCVVQAEEDCGATINNNMFVNTLLIGRGWPAELQRRVNAQACMHAPRPPLGKII